MSSINSDKLELKSESPSFFELGSKSIITPPSSVSIDVYTPEGFWANYLRGIGDNPSVSYYGSREYTEEWINNHPGMPPYGNLAFVDEPMVFYYEDFKLTPGSDITQADIDMWASVDRGDIVRARQLANQLKNDSNFYKTACFTAKNNYDGMYSEKVFLENWEKIMGELNG